ncbi:hypothetical protein PRIC1_007476 [Phytophthora ramorum]|uniref:uncharacterized protein n=1 Tax=Phytophthora ramorum TaxID=164328 RepID=UPI0030A06AF4|nr:hypothetical protein KRP23_2357 [Phytophthora ramorum]KAH7502318.1 hypothetical protein KRP22_7786 [Phytophthora ramorum]
MTRRRVTEVFGYPLYVAETRDSADIAAPNDDSSEAEEKTPVSPPTRKRPREDPIVTDFSTVSTRAQQRQKRHQPKCKNTPWPSRLSRAKRHRAKRAPVRYGNTVLFAHVVPADAQRRQSQELPRRHGGM